MTAKTDTAAPTSHRLVNLRALTAGCSCGAIYTTTTTVREEATANLRAQHRDHKAAPVPPVAKKAPARKAATKVAPAVVAKPRARRTATKTSAK